jgi:hypothetical protein
MRKERSSCNKEGRKHSGVERPFERNTSRSAKHVLGAAAVSIGCAGSPHLAELGLLAVGACRDLDEQPSLPVAIRQVIVRVRRDPGVQDGGKARRIS